MTDNICFKSISDRSPFIFPHDPMFGNDFVMLVKVVAVIIKPMSQHMDERDNALQFQHSSRTITYSYFKCPKGRAWTEIPPNIFHGLYRSCIDQFVVQVIKFLPVVDRIRYA